MRLSKIKIAGFKSFVDATTIEFTGNLTGIIGPNGCGKSNTIDAVRWVMGESSAKHLRGASMDDVIFKGSSARAPVGKAYVELVFDNSDGSCGGQYAKYAEISTRREVSRDGKSNYYLNGSKCRRRDITDIFLGTGLGPRSYAIIEQGMISRLIEAKPEEIRVYIEEAAGISKYKERRRDTELRIRNTRENLARLDDLRDEIGKQLNRLERQAQTAAKYREYKQSEREQRAKLLALKYRELQNIVSLREREAQLIGTAAEAELASVRNFEAEHQRCRLAQQDASDRFNQINSEWYQVGNSISSSEQNIRHFKENRERQIQDLAQLESAWQAADAAINEDQERLEDIADNLQSSQTAYKLMQQTVTTSHNLMQQAEAAMQTWQHDWDSFNQQFATNREQQQLASSHRDQAERRINELLDRLDKTCNEFNNLESSDLAEAIAIAEIKLQECSERQQQLIDQNQQANAAVSNARSSLQQQDSEISQRRGQLHRQNGELTSLQALQRAALGRDNSDNNKYLAQHQLDSAARLGELLTSKAGWELALETVLGGKLEALCIDDFAKLEQILPEFKQGAISFADRNANLNCAYKPDAKLALTPLLDFVESPLELADILAEVYTAADLPTALQLRGELKAGQSIILSDGTWLGATWLQLSRNSDAGAGVISRERAIHDLQQQIEHNSAQLENLEAKVQQISEDMQTAEALRDDSQRSLQKLNGEHGDMRAQLSALNARASETARRREYLSQEQADLNQHLAEARLQLGEFQENLAAAKLALSGADNKRAELQQNREALQDKLNDARHEAQRDKDNLQAMHTSINSMQNAKDSTSQNLARMQTQLQHLQQRRSQLQNNDLDDDSPLIELQQQLEALLQRRVELDHEINTTRAELDQFDNQLRQFDAGKAQAQAAYDAKNQELQQHKLDAQEHKVRAQTFREQLDETGFALNALLEQLDATANIGNMERELDKLVEKINRLGAINLAAIDEFATESERKQHLDAQHEDLSAALATLESAIAKIDAETKSRFKETFDQVNQRISEMFPKLFGGGQAYLELTDDDLLNTGVSIMARPPGKRISNIHLLSGGEKALTAVAMVFAIFELNPAPFCMLDEVDAPLDEANVGRFCNLVREMSASVQFIFITHNKPAMEMAQQLHGVTMREAGVSRIVAVDVDEAVKMVD